MRFIEDSFKNFCGEKFSFFPSIFFWFSVRKTIFRVLRLTSLIFCGSCGTDDSCLNNCGKDLRYFSALSDFSIHFVWSKCSSLTFIKVFGLKKKHFASPKFHFWHHEPFFPKKIIFDSKNGFPLRKKVVFESYASAFGYFLEVKLKF